MLEKIFRGFTSFANFANFQKFMKSYFPTLLQLSVDRNVVPAHNIPPFRNLDMKKQKGNFISN